MLARTFDNDLICGIWHGGLHPKNRGDFEHPEIYRLLIHCPKDDLLFFHGFL
jgi:hypothetical protein